MPQFNQKTATRQTPQYFQCLNGYSSGNILTDAIIGRYYTWIGEWIQSPEDVKDRDKNPVMRLHPLCDDEYQHSIIGDISDFKPLTTKEEIEDMWVITSRNVVESNVEIKFTFLEKINILLFGKMYIHEKICLDCPSYDLKKIITNITIPNVFNKK